MEASRTAQSAAVCPALNGENGRMIRGHRRPEKWSLMPLSQRRRRLGRLKLDTGVAAPSAV